MTRAEVIEGLELLLRRAAPGICTTRETDALRAAISLLQPVEGEEIKAARRWLNGSEGESEVPEDMGVACPSDVRATVERALDALAREERLEIDRDAAMQVISEARRASGYDADTGTTDSWQAWLAKQRDRIAAMEAKLARVSDVLGVADRYDSVQEIAEAIGEAIADEAVPVASPVEETVPERRKA